MEKGGVVILYLSFKVANNEKNDNVVTHGGGTA